MAQSDHKVSVRIASGTVYTTTNAMSWAAYDLVEVYFAVGNNVASVAKYRINGGSWTDLVLSTVPDVPNPGSAEITFFTNIGHAGTVGYVSTDTQTWDIWLHRLTVHQNGAPSGV
jgi:hypothetical protein